MTEKTAESELYVGLKVPDTTAITTLHTIEKMGFKSVKKVIREDYYKFAISCGKEPFERKITKVDVLVNANKNTFSTKPQSRENSVSVLVTNTGDKCEGILQTLRERLGIKEILSMERGVFWTLIFECQKNKEKIAEEIANNLLHNPNFQEIKIMQSSVAKSEK